MPELKLKLAKASDMTSVCECVYYVDPEAENEEFCYAELWLYYYGSLYVNKQAILRLKDITNEKFYRLYDTLCDKCIPADIYLRESYFNLLKLFLEGVEYHFSKDDQLTKIIIPDAYMTRVRNKASQFAKYHKLRKEPEYEVLFAIPVYFNNILKDYLILISQYIYSGYLECRKKEGWMQEVPDSDYRYTFTMYHRSKMWELYISYNDCQADIEDVQKRQVFANMPYYKTIEQITENRF